MALFNGSIAIADHLHVIILNLLESSAITLARIIRDDERVFFYDWYVMRKIMKKIAKNILLTLLFLTLQES